MREQLDASIRQGDGDPLPHDSLHVTVPLFFRDRDGPAGLEPMEGAGRHARCGSELTNAKPSVDWLFGEYRKMGVWRKKESRTRDEWEAAWTVIKPVFADALVSETDFAACDEFYTGLEEKFSLHKKHRVFKIFRALLCAGPAT